MTTVSSASGTSNGLSSYLNTQAAVVANDKAGSASSSASSSNSWASITGDFDTFLTILTTELQNQDPTQAMDTSEFTNQLVQFAGVEQQIGTNDKLDTLISQGNAVSTQALLGYVGGWCQVDTDGTMLLQDGESYLSYDLASAASNVKINVYDSTGALVTALDGSAAKGTNRISWDGKDSSGNAVDDGEYTFKITATDSSGASIAVSNEAIIAKVTGVSMNDSSDKLMMGDYTVAASDVSAVYSSVTVTD